MKLSRKCSHSPAQSHRERRLPWVLEFPCPLFEAEKPTAPVQTYDPPSLPCNTFHGRKDVLEQMDCYFAHNPAQRSGQLSFALCGFGRCFSASV